MSPKVRSQILFALTVASAVVGALAATPGIGKLAGVAAVLTALFTNLKLAFTTPPDGKDDGAPPALLLLFGAWVALVSSAGCEWFRMTAAPKVVNAAECVKEEIGRQIPEIMPEVATALGSANFVSLLTDLGKRVGFTVVDCAVAELGAKSRAQLADAPNDAMARERAEHAAAWLAR